MKTNSDAYSPRHGTSSAAAGGASHGQRAGFPVWASLCGVGALIIAAVVLFAMLIRFDVLPSGWLIGGGCAVAAVIVLLSVGCDSKKNGLRIFCFTASLLLAIVLAVACLFLGKTMRTISGMYDDTAASSTDVSLVVLADSSLETLEDVSGTIVGMTHIGDTGQMSSAVSQMEAQLGENGFSTLEAASFAELAGDLYAGNVDAILLTDSHRGMVTDSYPDFSAETRAIAVFEGDKPAEEEKNENAGTSRLSKEVKITEGEDNTISPFVVFLTGIDTYGGTEAESRSDVNILAVVNPQTKKLLLVTTPRDSYVELPMCYYELDKLTHAGLYGVEGSMETLENLYGIEIQKYVRLNFSGFINIVDALDGIEVNLDYEYGFSAHSDDWETWYDFEPGINYLNGEEALAFVRCRDFSDGDFQRGKNQMAAIQGILDKVMSPAILTSYMSLMDSISGCFTMNFTDEEISALVKMQLEDNAQWEISSVEVSGWADEDYCYNLGASASIVMLDPDSVEEVKTQIADVLGE